MSWFIKTERFTSETMNLSAEKRQHYINKHRAWIISLCESGVKISSGYLVNEHGFPGGGGLLMVQAKSFKAAQSLIEQDPMIIAGLVNWELHQWKPVAGKLQS